MMCNLEQIGSSGKTNEEIKASLVYWRSVSQTAPPHFFFVTKSEESKGFLNT